MAKKISELTQLTSLASNDKIPILDTSASATKQFNLSTLIDMFYPIGSIYISTSSTNPSTKLGGTWTQIKDTFLLTAGDTYTAGATGGNATHTLSISEMPTHTHEIWNGNVYPATINGQGSGTYYNMSYSDLTNQGGQLQAKDTGGNQPFDIMPPYKVVYAWERTA